MDQLDTVKCADLVVLVWDSSFSIDPLMRTCLFAQGNFLHIIPSIDYCTSLFLRKVTFNLAYFFTVLLYLTGLPPVQHIVMQLGLSFSDKEFNIQKKQFSEILQKNNFSINNSKVSSNSISKVPVR